MIDHERVLPTGSWNGTGQKTRFGGFFIQYHSNSLSAAPFHGRSSLILTGFLLVSG
ncbi:hypothetical protein QCD79_32460 [Pseudomonas quasicaspiana]|nr:hypothetical protein [Pseudomonas quasicaspiana]